MSYKVRLAVAVLEGLDDRGRDGLVAALVGDEQQAGQVERDAGPADDRQDDADDPAQRRVAAEVAAPALGHAGPHAALERAAQGGTVRAVAVTERGLGPRVGLAG